MEARGGGEARAGGEPILELEALGAADAMPCPAPLDERVREVRSLAFGSGEGEGAGMGAGISAVGCDVALGCAPTADGVLTAVGLAYLARLPQESVRVLRTDRAQPRLGEAYGEVATDPELASRVFRGFSARMRRDCPQARHGQCPYGCPSQCARRVVFIAAADDEDMPEALHGYLVAGFAHGRAIRTLNTLPLVARAEELSVRVANECEKARQFVRFSRLESGVFHAAYEPNANVVPLVAGHFAKRMAEERFAIVDASHDVAVLYAKGKVLRVELPHQEAVRLSVPRGLSDDEPYVRALWKRFYDALALPGRGPEQRGYDLRRQFMPKRLWQGLIELSPASDEGWNEVPSAYRARERRSALESGATALPR